MKKTLVVLVALAACHWNGMAQNSATRPVSLPRIGTLAAPDSSRDMSKAASVKVALSQNLQSAKQSDNVQREQKEQSPQPMINPSVKVGLLAQVQGQVLEEQTTAAQDATPNYRPHWQRQVLLRRLRVLVGGGLGKNTSFFFESDAPNIGKVEQNGTKATKVQMYVQDAQIQHVVAPEFSIIAGLQLVGMTRNSLQSAASLMALDYGAYQFLASTALDNVAGRDIGVDFRGFLLDERLEYRAGVFSGKNVNLYSPLRTVARVSYMFGDREKGYFYTGTTLGSGRLLTFGIGTDQQGTYRGYSADAMLDIPLLDLGSLTASGSVSLIDGGGSSSDSTFFTGALPHQTIAFAEVGYYFKDLAVQPYVKYESQVVNTSQLNQVGATPATLDLQNALRSRSRYGVGVNYFLDGHNTSVKVLYELVQRNRPKIDPTQYERTTTGEFYAQFQYYIY